MCDSVTRIMQTFVRSNDASRHVQETGNGGRFVALFMKKSKAPSTAIAKATKTHRRSTVNVEGLGEDEDEGVSMLGIVRFAYAWTVL